jgi:hypothetical protein
MLLDIRRRYGKIEVNSDLLDNPTELSKVFSLIEFAPVHIENLQSLDILTYYGFSPKFDILELGQKAPQYIVQIKRQHDESNASIIIEADITRSIYG